VVDDEGIVVAWHPAAEKLLGYSAQQVVGRATRDLVVVDGPTGREPSDVVLRHRDGRHIGCRVRVSAEHRGQEPLRWRVQVARSEEDEASAAVDRALMRALFTRSPVGLFVLDADLRLVRYNTAAEGMQGTRVSEGVGLRPTEAWPDFSAQEVEQVMAEVLRTGQPVLAFRPAGPPGRGAAAIRSAGHPAGAEPPAWGPPGGRGGHHFSGPPGGPKPPARRVTPPVRKPRPGGPPGRGRLLCGGLRGYACAHTTDRCAIRRTGWAAKAVRPCRRRGTGYAGRTSTPWRETCSEAVTG
jgi:PAS domain-containing protein